MSNIIGVGIARGTTEVQRLVTGERQQLPKLRTTLGGLNERRQARQISRHPAVHFGPSKVNPVSLLECFRSVGGSEDRKTIFHNGKTYAVHGAKLQ